jgi:glycosyltransferase involved in cell wall biosynthesis
MSRRRRANERPEAERLVVPYLCLQVTREGQASYAHVHEIISGLREDGLNVELFEPRYPDDAVQRAKTRMLEFLRVQNRLRPHLRTADAVYIRAHFAAYLTAMRARRRGIPVIQEVNGPYGDLFAAWPKTRPLAPLFRWLMRAQYRKADVLITVTDGLKRWLEAETGRGDVHVIPNGANVEVFAPGAPRPDRPLPDRYAVFFGALASWQGVDVMLEAMTTDAWPPDLGLAVAGDGAMRSLVLQAAERDPRVIYLGTLPYREMPGLIANALCGLSPQVSGGRSESGLSPLKMYETLACGVPVVVSDFPGQSELVRENRVGAVVAPEDPLALAKGVRDLLADESERASAGARGRALIVAGHSWRARAHTTFRAITEGVEHA